MRLSHVCLSSHRSSLGHVCVFLYLPYYLLPSFSFSLVLSLNLEEAFWSTKAGYWRKDGKWFKNKSSKIVNSGTKIFYSILQNVRRLNLSFNMTKSDRMLSQKLDSRPKLQYIVIICHIFMSPLIMTCHMTIDYFKF